MGDNYTECTLPKFLVCQNDLYDGRIKLFTNNKLLVSVGSLSLAVALNLTVRNEGNPKASLMETFAEHETPQEPRYGIRTRRPRKPVMCLRGVGRWIFQG